ncbi:hypothetical protein FYJ28_06580 [Arthrobacter sp. BL-252-APC-1A]|uniref:hypothetical protein n=1 Tax=Arthrobacter sp. BL-252-APC-1A TaxID=2606622 RepID=UPI0012B39287|nr:hypothetical protein [Arthrobacter sp. BL-252-APC-1A]MSR98490.1 hypothetical protein [Arthrobacter sp. BL-252-APC-1A]
MEIVLGVAEILAAIGTVGALFFILRQTRHTSATLEQTQGMLTIEQRREQRTLAEQAQRQAAGLVCWPVKIVAGAGAGEWGVELVNASPAPVFACLIDRPEGLTKKGRTIQPIKSSAAILAPGRYFVQESVKNSFPVVLQESTITEPILGNINFSAVLTFTDSNGMTWQRDIDGTLSELVKS